MTETKRCSKCGVEKPLGEYSKRADGRLHGSSCKQCEAEKSRQWRKDNPEKKREQRRKWAKDNPEKNREMYLRAGAKWRKANAEEIRNRDLQRKHGLTLVGKRDWYESQNGRVVYAVSLSCLRRFTRTTAIIRDIGGGFFALTVIEGLVASVTISHSSKKQPRTSDTRDTNASQDFGTKSKTNHATDTDECP